MHNLLPGRVIQDSLFCNNQGDCKMKFDPDKHHRRSIRLHNFDYTGPGAYFITICTKDRLCFFGDIVDERMVLNDAGYTIENWYLKLADKFDVLLDEFVIMPNHLHGIILQGEHMGSPLHRVVQWFKTMTTNEYIRGIKTLGWCAFAGKLWHRNYWEHIVRNDDELNLIRNYILTNPTAWALDHENPAYIEGLDIPLYARRS